VLILARVIAGIIDGIFVLTYVLCVGFTATYFGIASKDSPALSAFDCLFILLYYGCLDARAWGGGTIGKRLCRLVVGTDYSPSVPLYRSFARTAVKLGVPVLVFKVGADVAFFHGFIGAVVVFAALLLIPTSVITGQGLIGIHDSVAGTWVASLKSKVPPVMQGGRLRHLRLTIITTAVLSLSVAAWLRSFAGVRELSFGSLVKSSSGFCEVEKDFLTGNGSELIRPFVQHIAILPSAWEFPTDYDRSYSKVPADIAKEFRGRKGAGVIVIELTSRGSDQRILESALLDRIVSVTLPRLLMQGDLPAFVWVAFDSKSTLGPVSIDEAHTCVIMVRSYPADRKQMQVMLAEPSDHRFVAAGIGMAGFTMTNVPF
jgi:uncharacterized RDD family membrane protein YckC